MTGKDQTRLMIGLIFEIGGLYHLLNGDDAKAATFFILTIICGICCTNSGRRNDAG